MALTTDNNKILKDTALIMVVFVIGLLLFSLCSCNMCKWANKRCPAVIHDSIIYKETVKYRDTTIYVRLPKDTVKINDTVYVKQGLAFMPKIWRQIGIITATAEIKKSRLYVDAYLNDTSFKVNLKNAIKERNFWHERYNEKVKVIREQYIPDFYKFAMWYAIASWVLIVIGITLYVAKKMYLP